MEKIKVFVTHLPVNRYECPFYQSYGSGRSCVLNDGASCLLDEGKMCDMLELGMKSESKTRKVLASAKGVIVAVCSKCGCRVAFENDRFCRGCGKEFET